LPHDQLLRSVDDVNSLKRPSQRTTPATVSALASRPERIENFILAAAERKNTQLTRPDKRERSVERGLSPSST